MTIWLEKLRLIVTTKDVTDAGSDERVDLEYVLDNELKSVRLNHPWDDREQGRTEMYEIAVDQASVGTANDPPGREIGTWNDVKNIPVRLRIYGNDAWLIDDYLLIGYFHDSVTFPARDLGWYLMAYGESDIWLSTDSNEGAEVVNIEINGPLPSEPGSLPTVGVMLP